MLKGLTSRVGLIVLAGVLPLLLREFLTLRLRNPYQTRSLVKDKAADAAIQLSSRLLQPSPSAEAPPLGPCDNAVIMMAAGAERKALTVAVLSLAEAAPSALLLVLITPENKPWLSDLLSARAPGLRVRAYLWPELVSKMKRFFQNDSFSTVVTFLFSYPFLLDDVEKRSHAGTPPRLFRADQERIVAFTSDSWQTSPPSLLSVVLICYADVAFQLDPFWDFRASFAGDRQEKTRIGQFLLVKDASIPRNLFVMPAAHPDAFLSDVAATLAVPFSSSRIAFATPAALRAYSNALIECLSACSDLGDALFVERLHNIAITSSFPRNASILNLTSNLNLDRAKVIINAQNSLTSVVDFRAARDNFACVVLASIFPTVAFDERGRMMANANESRACAFVYQYNRNASLNDYFYLLFSGSRKVSLSEALRIRQEPLKPLLPPEQAPLPLVQTSPSAAPSMLQGEVLTDFTFRSTQGLQSPFPLFHRSALQTAAQTLGVPVPDVFRRSGEALCPPFRSVLPTSPTVGLVVVSHAAPETFVRSVEGWSEGGLLGLFDDRVVVLSAPSPVEVSSALAAGFRVYTPHAEDIAGVVVRHRQWLSQFPGVFEPGFFPPVFPYKGDPRRPATFVGPAQALAYLDMSTDLILFLEKDFVLRPGEPRVQLVRTLLAAVASVSAGTAAVLLRRLDDADYLEQTSNVCRNERDTFSNFKSRCGWNTRDDFLALVCDTEGIEARAGDELRVCLDERPTAHAATAPSPVTNSSSSSEIFERRSLPVLLHRPDDPDKTGEQVTWVDPLRSFCFTFDHMGWSNNPALFNRSWWLSALGHVAVMSGPGDGKGRGNGEFEMNAHLLCDFAGRHGFATNVCQLHPGLFEHREVAAEESGIVVGQR